MEGRKMTPDEFEFWQKAYLAVLNAALTLPENYDDAHIVQNTVIIADASIRAYRAAKATVVQTTYATPD